LPSACAPRACASRDDRSEKLGYKIREAQVQKVPYMLVVGDKEAESGAVSVRHRQAGDWVDGGRGDRREDRAFGR